MAKPPPRRRPSTGDAPKLRLVPPPERPEQPPPGAAPQRARVIIEQPADASEGARRTVDRVQRGLDEIAESRRLKAVAKTLAQRSEGELLDALTEIVSAGRVRDAVGLLHDHWQRGHRVVWWEGSDALGWRLVGGREDDGPEVAWSIALSDGGANPAAVEQAKIALQKRALPAALKRAA